MKTNAAVKRQAAWRHYFEQQRQRRVQQHATHIDSWLRFRHSIKPIDKGTCFYVLEAVPSMLNKCGRAP